MRFVNSGSGRGPQTNDGCSVEFYRRLPYTDELEDIAGELRGHQSLLELGCGVGRLASRILELGVSYVGVDDSVHMLSHLPAGVEGICASIESLQLERSYSAVLLASYLINVPDVQRRRAFVESAFRQLEPKGRLYIQRHNPDWLATVQTGSLGRYAGFELAVEAVERRWPWVTLTLRYDLADDVWRQRFTAEALSVGQISTLLAEAGFCDIKTCGLGELWITAQRSEVAFDSVR